MTKTVSIEGRRVGHGEPVFIIAEAGVNHNGQLELARELVDAACETGVDAVKFQTFKTEHLVTRKAGMAEYQKKQMKEIDSQFQLIKSLELEYDMFVELKQYCDEKGILFLSTPHSPDAAVFLDSLLPAYKVGSGDLTNLPFLRQVADFGKPILLSTGMATLDEVTDAVHAISDAGNQELVLLHCVTNYPADIRTVNLKAMNTLRNAFDLPVGFSDHTMGLAAVIAAVSLGACVIEKHFTLSRELPGPDHKASLEPRELQEMVDAIRDVEMALGDGVKKPTTAELDLKDVARKSIVSVVRIEKGTILTEEMIAVKRPGYGIPPKHWSEVIGRRAKKEIGEDEVLEWSSIE
ncbi:MAG: N-acetylneuraminate synthase [Candidatus Thorarchaeota archaeon SMTZ1-83]|nr:MAG: N-acetylneuraminate synthase [Candidatus Thorarchaeota archaeon SMTZ1-83]